MGRLTDYDPTSIRDGYGITMHSPLGLISNREP